MPEIKPKSKRGGPRVGAGRKPGSKDRRTLAKIAAGTDMIVARAPAVVAKAKPVVVHVSAKKGISPKDLLLHTMREAWDAYFRLLDEAQRVKGEAEEVGTGHPRHTGLMERAGTLKLAADMALEQACDMAVKAAPYEHPKLANVDNRIRGNVIVEIAKY
jgi:hypothetical protein